MRRDHRFFIGLTGVALVVGYLIWTGVSDTMLYYLTPTELLAKVEEDAAFHGVGLKVSGKVVPGTHEQRIEDTAIHTFVVHDLENESVRIPVEYRGTIPDTFTDEVEVVVEGRYLASGLFEATVVLTKCGSRYEAYPEDGVPVAYDPGGVGDRDR